MSQSVGVLGLGTSSYVVLRGFVIVLKFFVPTDARNTQVLVQHWCVRVWSDTLDQRMVVTPLVRCPRGCRPECDDKPCGSSVCRKGFCSQSATNFMMFFARPTATFLLFTVSRSRCS